MIWSFLIVGVGQLLVALIFSEIVAQYPVAGGVYPWARRLWGRRYAWMTGWVYIVALLVTIASVVYGAGPYIAAAFGIEATVNNTILFALGLLALATVINFMGTKVLATAAILDSPPRSSERWPSAGGCSSPTGSTTSASSSTASAPAVTATICGRSPPRH